jgi:hypothetical protein
LKPVFFRIVLALSFLLITLAGVSAKPPTLELNDSHSLPTEVKMHEPLEMSLKYTGDPPTKLALIVLTPDGETVTVPGKASVGDLASGVSVTWPYTPSESGEYRYHFEAQAGDLGGVRFPTSPANDYQFVVASVLTRYIVLGLGLLICLLLLPFVSYTATRGLNQRGDPAAAARIALLIGVVAYIGLALCVLLLDSADYVKWLSFALGGVLVLAVLVGLFSRRRVA